MTISGKSFLDLQSQMAKLKEKATSNELSSGTETSPQPIQITSSEAQTVSDALKNSKVQINPAIIKTQQTTPTAVMTAAEPTTKEEEQKIMKDNLLQQKKKVDAETKGMRVDHTNPYSMAHYVQSVGDVLTSLKTAWTTWGTQSLSDVEDKGEMQLDLDYAAAQQNVNSQKEARQKFSNIYQGNYKNTNFQINLLGPQIGIKNGINTLNWMGNYPNKWITNDGSEAMMTNGTTTLSSPIIHIADYEGDMAKAYDTVTYAAAQDGVVVTPQYLKENFPGFADQPDTIVQNFIDDCLYDVQQGSKRPLEMYFDYYQGLAKSDKYVNKQDSILDAVTDDSIINNSLGYYMGGYVEMEGRTAEEWQEYVNAAYMIKARANAINNEGFNETGAGDYILAKTFADSIPELKKAIDTYDKFDIKTSEILKLESQYNSTMQDMKDFIDKVDRSTANEYNKMVRSYAHDYLDQFNREFMNSWNAQRLQGDLWYAGSSPMQNWLWGKYYEKNGKWYNSKGNEITPEEAEKQKAFITDYLESVMQIPRLVDELGYDIERVNESYGVKKKEMGAVVGFDSILLTFSALMNFTGMGVKFQVGTHLPIVGTWLEGIYNFLMEDMLGGLAMGVANMTQFTEGWEKESIEKYKEAMGGLGLMILGTAKTKLVGKGKPIDFSDKALSKAWKAAVNKFTDGLIKLEVEPAKIQDIIREKNALPKETGKKPTTRKEVEQQRKGGKTTEGEIKIEGKEAEGEKIEGETAGAKKPMFLTTITKDAMSEFNRVFEEEYQKENAGKGTTFVDDLFNKARELYTQITRDRNVDIDAKLAELEKRTTETPETMETPKAETTTTTPTEETVSLTETTPETATQPAEQTTVSETIETAPETPGVKVEQASTKAPTDVEGKIESKEEKNIKETKTTINRILDFIQDLQNTGNEIFNKVRKLTEKSETKKAREREIQRQKDEQLLRDAGLDNESIDLVMNNPFGETLLDVINAMTKEITDKKGKIKEVQKEMDLKNNEIQRETLAEGIKEIQEYVDKLIEMKNKLGKIYEELSLKREIDTYDFAESEALGNVLEGFGYKIEIRFDEETEQPYAVVSKTKDVRPKPSEAAQMKYIQDFINKQLRFEKISEADAQAIRESLKWNEDTYGKEGRSKALENSLRDAFNKFLDEQKGTDLLRKIDEGYSKIADAITDLKEILQKDNQVKDNAANKILNWDEETLNQMEELVPGIKDLVDLARKAPEIVKKGVTAKMKMKDTRRWLADPVRYTFVGLPTLIGASVGGLPGGLIGTVIGSFIFKWSENIGNKLKSKIVGKEPDLKIYNAFVDNLSLSDKEKAAYKIDALKNIEEIRKQIVGERESSFNKIMEEVNKIIIDRKAADILDQKGGTEPTTPKKPKGPDDKTPPAGETEETMTPAEKKIVEASLGKDEGETYSPKAEKIADELLKLEKTVDDVTTDYATEKLEERGEDVTPQNIEKVKQEEVKEGGIEEFLAEMEAGEKHTTDPTEPDYRKTDLDTLIEIAEHPEKYPNVDINAVNDAIEYILQKNAMAEARDGGGMRGSDIDMGYTFAAEVDRVNGMEQRMADAKTPEAKEKLKKEWIKAKEDVIEEISQAYNIDQFEAADKFDELSNASLKTIEEGNKTKNGYKEKHRIVKAEQDKLLALMGKGPSQNITYTSSSDNIAKMENPASRKRVAEQRIRQVVDPKIEKSKIGVNKDKINRNVAKRTAEKQALEAIIEKANEELKGEQEKLDKKVELAKETKKLIDKRKNTKSREEKKELTKEIDKNEDAFEKLTYEEAGELFSKPKEVEEMEAKEQGEKQEFDKAMDENETPQKGEKQMEDDLEGISMEVEGYDPETQIGAAFVTVFKNGKKIGEYNGFQGNRGLTETQMAWVKENMYKPEFQKGSKKQPKTVKELKEKGFTDEEIEKLQNLNIASDPLNEYLADSTKVPEAYKAMNRELADVQAEFVDTMRALSKLDNYEGELRRGGNGKEFGENIKEGDTIENKKLLFSSDEKIENSAYKDSSVYYKINAKGKGTKDSVIEGGKERDFVTMPGQKFKVDKITKEGDKTIYEITEIDEQAEAPKKTEAKKPEPKKEEPKQEEKGSEPLMKVESDGYVYNEPSPGDLTSKVIFERIEYIRNKAKETGKLMQKERVEFEKLKDLYKRQLEWEAREKQAEITDEELDDMYERMYTRGPVSTAGIDLTPYTD